MRLIDADNLAEVIIDLYRTGEYDCASVLKAIDNTPTVKTYCYFCGQTEHGQIEERPQGEWEHDELFLDVKCSICHSYALECGDYPEFSPYCPHCGAKMKI